MSKIYLFSKTPSTSEGVIHIKILQTHYFSPPSNIYDYDFLIITSKEAINALLEIDKSRVELICISKKSAEYALSVGFRVACYADGYATSMAQLLETKYKNRRLLYLRAKVVASDVLLTYDNYILYETFCQSEPYNLESEAVLIFTSPSAIRCFLELNSFNERQKIVCIGSTTQQAIPKGRSSFLAELPSITSCIEKVKELLLL